MKLSTVILTVLHLSSIVLMLIVLNRHSNKNSFHCPFCELFELPFLARTTCFHLANGGFTSRLSRPQWVRCYWVRWFEGSSKFMATLQVCLWGSRRAGESLRLSPNLFSRRSCSSVEIRASIKYSHRLDFCSIDSVHGRTLVWWYTSSLPKYFVN